MLAAWQPSLESRWAATALPECGVRAWLSPEDHGDPYDTTHPSIRIFLNRSSKDRWNHASPGLATHAAAVSAEAGPYSPGEHYDATRRAWLDPRDRRQSNARRCCHSAWGPNADQRTNSLNCPRKEGSTSKADSHVGPADHLQACALVAHILVGQIDPTQYEAS